MGIYPVSTIAIASQPDSTILGRRLSPRGIKGRFNVKDNLKLGQWVCGGERPYLLGIIIGHIRSYAAQASKAYSMWLSLPCASLVFVDVLST
jgi:hypothetical protein